MAWQIRFIPDEVEGITVLCNGAHALDWSSAEGEVTKAVPAQWATLPHVNFRADGSPNGDNAHIQIFWNDQFRHNMEFDNGEDWDS